LNPLVGSEYHDNEPCRVPCPSGMLKVAQDQHTNNQDARIVRFREMICPILGNPNSRNDLVSLFVENPLFADDDLTDVLALDMTELMQAWEARPISVFGCLVPSCRAPIPVRGRTHLLRLIRLDWFFGLKVGAGDLVEFKALGEMLCESCGQELQHCHDEERRADLCVRRARLAELHQMTYAEYLRTPEWRARRNRVLIRAGNKCELCYANGLIDVHHRTYDRYTQELLSDLIALCRSCHKRFHGIEPKAA
jgi:5-methylcytosine-specific restriction endonuclease McrA